MQAREKAFGTGRQMDKANTRVALWLKINGQNKKEGFW